VGPQAQGALALLALLGALPFSGLPTDYVGLGVLTLTALVLERFRVRLGETISFSPAFTVALGAAFIPSVGPAVGLILLVFQGLAYLQYPFLVNLTPQLAWSVAVPAAAFTHLLEAGGFWLSPLVGLSVFLIVQWNLLYVGQPPKSKEEKALWYQLHLRVRPLEVGFALGALLVPVCYNVSPYAPILLLPLLATGRLAAENVLLRAHDANLEHLLAKLKGATSQARRSQAHLDRARTEKQLLEGFAALLARKPDLATAANSLVDTASDLMDVDNVALFLGTPPEPFSYRCTEEERIRLQGSALTGLTEPVVDKAHSTGRAVHRREAGDDGVERLFIQDRSMVAYPIGSTAVLYLGRRDSRPFTKSDLKQLNWLAEKAEIALKVALEEQRTRSRQRHLSRTVETLEHKIAWMGLLIKSTERLVSTLKSEALYSRLAEVLQEAIPHRSGFIELKSGGGNGWGPEVHLSPGLAAKIKEVPRSLHLQDLSTTPFDRENSGVASLLAAPIGKESELFGWVVLTAEESGAFSPQQADFLYLVCSQAAMALSNSQLFEEVVEARRQLEESQARLIQSSKMTAMGQLAAGVAHELNSPMGAISLSLEESIRQLESQPELARTMLVMAQEAVERSKEIVDRLMGYSRSPVGKVEILPLGEVLRETLLFLAPQLKSYGVQAHIVQEDSCQVRMEKQPIQQVIVNLFLNACQAMDGLPEEERRIEARVSCEDETAVLSVKDFGVGVKPEDQERIFDPFFTTKEVGKGTGLGLWVCHQIVQEHKGRIWVESRPHEGACFLVEFPVTTA